MTETRNWTLTISCDDRPGIVHTVTGACIAAGGNVTELQQYSSPDSGRFFMRLQLDSVLGRVNIEAALRPTMDALAATWSLDETDRKCRTLVLASKAAHCVNDLLFRQRTGYLPIEVPLVMANHPDLGDLVAYNGIAFEHHPVTPDTKADFERRVLQVIDEQEVELVVLARYMQILSPELCEALAGRAINIHHSFLPGFKGANPYRQAHARGVKLIGATAHFVTSDLDEGPIIEQNVQRVDHSRTPEQLMAIGQDTESRTLTEAVRLYAERRVFLDGRRTVIFD